MPRFSLAKIAEQIGGTLHGDEGTLEISGVQHVEVAREGDITVIHSRTGVAALAETSASAVVVPESVRQAGKPIVRVRAPRLALARLLELFHQRPREVTGIDARAVVAPSARCGRDVNIAAGAYVAQEVEIGDRVDIYPGTYLGEGVRIGNDSVIFANVSIYARTVIGKRARIHSGAVIGSDGFGFTPGPAGEHYKIPQVGNVVIGDDVEIGANTAVDRATLSDTRIGNGTKIDNLVQIGHNVCIGDHVCIVGQSGIAGSVHIHDRAVLAAAAGILDHVTIGEGARVAGRAGVVTDVPPRTSVGGTPAIPLQVAMRAYTLIAQLPDYRRKLRALEERCRRLEAELEKFRRGA